MSLRQWLIETGASISPKIQVEDLPGRGRSVICVDSPIKKGSQIIVIRRKQLLNKQTIRCDPSWTSKWNTLSSHQLLALFIYQNRNNPDCYWYPFLSQLPKLENFSSVPLYWYYQDNGQLLRMPPSVGDHVNRQRKVFEDDFSAVRGIIDDESTSTSTPSDHESSISSSTLLRFLESWLCVNSRCLYMKLPDTINKDPLPSLPATSANMDLLSGPISSSSSISSSENMTMAPFVDFLNHTPGGVDESVKVDFSAIGMIVTARKDYNPGDEVLLGYGPHDNTFLLCEYGFTVSYNPWDNIDVTSDILDKMKNRSQKAILYNMGYFGDYTVSRDGPSFRTEIALACLQESGMEGLGKTPHNLKLFADGITDGSKYHIQSEQILREILTEKAKIYEKLELNDIIIGYMDIINAFLKK